MIITVLIHTERLRLVLVRSRQKPKYKVNFVSGKNPGKHGETETVFARSSYPLSDKRDLNVCGTLSSMFSRTSTHLPLGAASCSNDTGRGICS